MIHEGMTCDPIQGQSHVALEVRLAKSISCAIFNGNWQTAADSLTRGKYLNLIGPDF